MSKPTFDPPNYKTYERACDQWAEWKRQAALLPLIELKRHAEVSTDNRHACRDCFTCACEEVRYELSTLGYIRGVGDSRERERHWKELRESVS